jgi:circadian clock protein KaiB
MRKKRKKEDATAALARAAKAQAKAQYVLKLYVAGVTPRSSGAIRSITDLCETHLQGRYALEIINIYQQPALAAGDQIIAAPTLLKKLPLPLRRLIGDMANQDKILVGLDLRPKP